jgi:DNA replication and repair protein RecF
LYFKKIHIETFRNIESTTLLCQPGFNILYGSNGAGKTSLLEAIYTLATGKSFRTHLPSRYIQHDQAHCLLSAAFVCQDKEHFIGVQRHKNGEKQLKLDQKPIKAIADIASLLPIQNISVDCHRIFSDSPKSRRSFIDWGVFHTKKSFINSVLQINRLLKQRNAALKQPTSLQKIQIWNRPFAEISQAIHYARANYLEKFNPIYNECLQTLLPELCVNAEIRYKPGWNLESDLEILLSQHIEREKILGSTQYGPHRADIQLYINKIPADDVLSQGQLKVAGYALHLAQGMLLKTLTGKHSIYLIDDLPSELDENKQKSTLKILNSLNSQIFITAINPNSLLMTTEENQKTSLFHVEHGIALSC